MKKSLLLLLILVFHPPVLSMVHVEAEDCNISSWNLSPTGAAVQIVIPFFSDVNAVEIVGGRSDATGVGQLRLPASIPNGEYAVVLRYFTNRTYSDSAISVQFGSNSGSVVAYATDTTWFTFYPDDASAAWYTWYDLELTPSGCPFPMSSSEPLPMAVGIYDVNEGDFYINIWDNTSNAYDLATIDYIELVPIPSRSSDITDDGYVDSEDLKQLTNNWLSYSWATDIFPPGSGDGVVNMSDFSFLAKDWWKAALHISDIIAVSSNSSCAGDSWSAEFTVSVKDKRGDPVSGVEVTGDWSGVHGSEGTMQQTTDASGQVVFTSNCIPIAGDTTFTVTSLSKSGHAYYDNENIETSDVASYSVAWSPIVRAEHWQVTAIEGNYAKLAVPSGKAVLLSTDNVGNPEYAMGDIKFTFPGAIPDGNYELTVYWKSGTMGGTVWAYILGTDGGSLNEVGVTSGLWHYFYPGHSGSHSDLWFLHDYAGPNPIDFSMWPNSPVSTHINVSGIGQGDFYIILRDLSPAENNYFSMEYFELTQIP